MNDLYGSDEIERYLQSVVDPSAHVLNQSTLANVTCLTMNYVFFSLQQHGRLAGSLETLFQRFWSRYLEKTRDAEMLKVAAPFFVFRGLVMAHPVWYPNISAEIRSKLFNFMEAVLSEESFDPAEVNRYCGA